MKCTTIKAGEECVFMAKAGCGFNGGSCKPVVEACDGCERVMEVESGLYCGLFPDPSSKWRLGRCNMATHVKEDIKVEAAKLNPLKASKRAAARV